MMHEFLSQAQQRRFDDAVSRLTDLQVLNRLMILALDASEAQRDAERAFDQLQLWQHEYAVRVCLATNDDQPGYDRASADAAVASMLDEEGGSYAKVLNRLIPEFDEEALQRGEYRVVTDEEVWWPNGRCNACGCGLDTNGQCDNEECPNCPRYGEPDAGEE